MLVTGLAQSCAIDGGRPGPGCRNVACVALSPDGRLACGHEHGSISNQVIQPVSAFPLRPQVLANRSMISKPRPRSGTPTLSRAGCRRLYGRQARAPQTPAGPRRRPWRKRIGSMTRSSTSSGPNFMPERINHPGRRCRSHRHRRGPRTDQGSRGSGFSSPESSASRCAFNSTRVSRARVDRGPASPGSAGRAEIPPGDIDRASSRARLSYRQAEVLFKTASGGVILHQLRPSALTHDAEDGVSTPMLIAKSRHIAVVSLARCARPSAEALGRWQVSRDLSLRAVTVLAALRAAIPSLRGYPGHVRASRASPPQISVALARARDGAPRRLLPGSGDGTAAG